MDGQGHTPVTLAFAKNKTPIPILQEDWWVVSPVRTGVESVTHTGIRTPDRPAGDKSLYRLNYTDSH